MLVYIDDLAAVQVLERSDHDKDEPLRDEEALPKHGGATSQWA